MADQKYLSNEATGLIDEIMRRNAVLEKQLSDLEREVRNQDTPGSLPRIDPVTYPSPYEGQRAIDTTDEQHTWYSDGLWRKAAIAGGSGFTAPIFIPVREVWTGDNQIEATGNFGTNDWTIDTTYPGMGYVQNTTDGGYISWAVLLGPKGSIWSWLPMLGAGADYGKVDIDFGTLPQSTFFTDNAGAFRNAPSNWVTLETIDCYNASTLKWLIRTTLMSFRIKGNLGDVGTAFSTIGEWNREWNGGPGPHRIRLRVNGKNASSTGFRIRCSGLVLVQFDDSALP